MFNAAKKIHASTKQDEFSNRRKTKDRRVSKEEIRFPFIDDEHKLVMKDRRIASRRESEQNLSKRSIKAVGKLLKK